MGSIGDVIGTTVGGMGQLSASQNQMLSMAPPEMRGMMEAQMKMEKEQQIVQFITAMMKALHEMAMSIIKNIA